MTERLRNKISNLKFVCAILVVLIHVRPVDLNSSWVWWYTEIIVNGIAQTAVPFFFATSGFLLARHFKEEGYYRREVVKRVKTLLFPFLLWNLIAFVAIKCLDAGRLQLLRDLPTAFGLDFFSFPVNVPLWFVRSLMIFVALSFVFKLYVFKTRFVGLLIVFLVYMVFSAGYWKGGEFWAKLHFLLENGLSIRGVFYFALGTFLGTTANCRKRRSEDRRFQFL